MQTSPMVLTCRHFTHLMSLALELLTWNHCKLIRRTLDMPENHMKNGSRQRIKRYDEKDNLWKCWPTMPMIVRFCRYWERSMSNNKWKKDDDDVGVRGDRGGGDIGRKAKK